MVAAPSPLRSVNAVSTPDTPAFSQPINPIWYLPVALVTRLSTIFLKLLAIFTFIVTLHSLDFIIFCVNLVSFGKSKDVVPNAFSPASPPPFSELPGTWIMCRMIRMMPEGMHMEWMSSWTKWGGIGYKGEWGGFQAPRPSLGQSRCPCPAINALANHGILPRHGRGITPAQLTAALARSYNLAPTLAVQLLAPFAPLFVERGYFNLEDLGAQGLVQHDGSVLREDINSPFAYPTVVATQAKPSQRLLNLYFPKNNPQAFGWEEHARILAHRGQASRAQNGSFVLSPVQYIFGSGNAAMTAKVVGGDQKYLRPFLGSNGYEQFIHGWQPRVTHAYGMTILYIQFYTMLVELSAGSLSGPRTKTKGDEMSTWNGNYGIAGASVTD